MAGNLILVVNPGSTSTKLALYDGEEPRSTETLRHDRETLNRFAGVWEQYDFRMDAVLRWVGARAAGYNAVAAIGGLLRPLSGGTYRVNFRMLDDARKNLQGEHVSNLGCAMAAALAEKQKCNAYIVDPVSVDEFEPLARYSGHPLVERRTLSHALNIHAAARRAAKHLNVQFEQSKFVIAHLGGGFSVAPVKGGKIIDVNDANSDGPFSPERTGGLPLQQFITLCYSGTYTEGQIRTLVRGRGGLSAYLGTNDAQEVERRIGGGDARAREVFDAMAYQIAKEIGAMAAVLEGSLHAIVLTGGLASSKALTDPISRRIRFIAPVLLFPGEDEMQALALGVLRVLRGDEAALEY